LLAGCLMPMSLCLVTAATAVTTAASDAVAAAYQVMMSLVGEPTASTSATAATLHPALCTAVGACSAPNRGQRKSAFIHASHALHAPDALRA
jgi:hypothetical protein